MSIRLSKAIHELNIGLQTAVEFLEKRNDLGAVRPDPNFKLNDDQYKALVEQFKSDKEAKSQVEKLFSRHAKEKKRATQEEETQTQTKSSVAAGIGKIAQKFRSLGKIDLKTIGAKLTSRKDEPKKAEPAAEPEKQPVTQPEPEETAKIKQPAKSAEPEKKEATPAEAAAPVEADAETPVADKPAVQPETAEEEPEKHSPVEAKEPSSSSEMPEPAQPVAENAPEEKEREQEKTVVEPQPEPESKPAPAATQTAPEKEVFTLQSERNIGAKVNVIGKIDLSTINSSTRPQKKTKDDRRKERDNKTAANGGERRKRARISKARVDIAAAAKQVVAGNNGNNANRNGAGNVGGNTRKKNRKRVQKQLEVDSEDVARQVKETLARLTSKSYNKKGAKYRKEKREAVQEHLKEQRDEERAESKTLKLTEFVTVSELASMMNISVNQVISTCMSIGIMVSINQRLDAETINIVADEFGFKTEYVSAEVSEAITEEADDENDLVPRAPIVTVMGHVDHGKTSLLDHIRNTNVIAGEAGGITQHIGAYNVVLPDGRRITFLDTPGHEAFTAMRARGAQVTDIAIIIIAADDSVMPTTREAIAHAQAANVPMVFAINKIDKPGANPDKIREDLAKMNLLVEEWGGKYQCQEISAKKGTGVDELLEKVLLEAEMLDLKANPNRKATGHVIESSLDKGRGYISTVLVSNGTLRVGDNVIAGTCYGRIKAMFNERNQRIDKALPAEPVIILGLSGAPTAGDTFHVLDTEQEARDIANKRMQLQREQGLRTQKRLTLSDISHRIALGSFKELNIIVKGDTDGSVEALSDSFIKLSTEKIKVNVIHKAVGQISESDVTLADASDAIIVGFQVRPSSAARKLAESEGVEINTYSIIYDAIEDIRSAMEGMLDKVVKEEVTAEIEVRAVYKISKVGTVAGCYVIDGKVHRSDKVRVVRDGIVIHTGEINALKRFKDDVKEVTANFECGISIVNFNDIMEGDMIEAFTEIEVKQKL